MSVGSLELIGTIDVSSIQTGLSNVRRGLDEAKESAKSAFSDMNRLGGSITSMAAPLAKIGTAVSGTFIGLSTLAPQIQPHLERMKTEFFRMSTIIGDVFEPVFNRMADAFSGFTTWLSSPSGQGVLEGAKDIMMAFGDSISNTKDSLENIGKNWSFGIDINVGSGIKWVVENLGAEIAAAIVGKRFFGTTGAVAGFTGTLALSGLGEEEQTKGSVLKSIIGTGVGAGVLTKNPYVGAGAAGLAGIYELIKYITDGTNEEEIDSQEYYQNAGRSG